MKIRIPFTKNIIYITIFKLSDYKEWVFKSEEHPLQELIVDMVDYEESIKDVQ